MNRRCASSAPFLLCSRQVFAAPIQHAARYTSAVTRPDRNANDACKKLVSRLGISNAAAELYLKSRVVDLHVESYSFYRSFGYDLTRRHGPGINRALLFSQADLPRLLEADIAGATWSITANPLRPNQDRAAALQFQVNELSELLENAPNMARVVRNYEEFERARHDGAHAAFIGIQGANALPNDLNFLATIKDRILRITLLHMSDSEWGASSTPRPRFTHAGLTHQGFELIEALNHHQIGVDLAHIHPEGFWDAMSVHRRDLPVFVSHTGVRGVHDHFRNVDDRQLKAVAACSGVVGIMYHSMYLGDPLLSGRVETVARHVKHALNVAGADHVALGSDWDGLICTPRDMPTCLELPRLVDALLLLGVSEDTVTQVLGENFLRVVKQLRGGP